MVPGYDLRRYKHKSSPINTRPGPTAQDSLMTNPKLQFQNIQTRPSLSRPPEPRLYLEEQLQRVGPPHALPHDGGPHLLIVGLRLRKRRPEHLVHQHARRLLVGPHHNDYGKKKRHCYFPEWKSSFNNFKNCESWGLKNIHIFYEKMPFPEMCCSNGLRWFEVSFDLLCMKQMLFKMC